MRDSKQDGRYRPRCPSCGWSDTRPSTTRNFLDRLLGTFSLLPYRCRTCGSRFYRIRREPPPKQSGEESVK